MATAVLLDNVTLLLATSVTNLLLAASLLVFRKSSDIAGPAHLWAGGKLLLGLSEAIYLFGLPHGAFWTTTFPNFVGAAGLALETYAIWSILGFARGRLWVARLGAALALAQLLIELPHFPSPIRLTLVSLGILLQFSLVFLAFALRWRARSTLLRSLALGNALLVAAYGIRVFEAFSAGPDYSVATGGWGQTLAFTVLFLITQVNGFGFILTLRERADAQLRRLATLDALTETLNRRGFLDAARQFASLAERTRQPLSLLVVDVDRFKLINDRHGHAVGDELLMRLANVMRETLRSTDLLGRFGGDEFLVLLPDTPLPGAEKVARTLQHAFTRPPSPATVETGATVSIGLAERQPGEAIERTLERADRALYRAKRGGRDRIEADLLAAS